MTRYIPPPKRVPLTPAKPDMYEQAARASWMAPLIAFVFSFLARAGLSQQKEAAAILAVVGFLSFTIIALGFGFAIYALLGVKKRGPERVLAPAIAGLVFNTLVIALSLSILPAAKRVADAKKRQAQMANIQQQSEDVIAKFPGWFGVGRTDGGTAVVVAQWNNDAPGTALMKDGFAADFTLLSVVVDNSHGSSSLSIDPATTQLLLAGGETRTALPPMQILNTAKEDKDKLVQRHGRPRSVSAGEKLVDGLAFLPPRADLTHVTAVTVVVNGQRIEVPGHYYSAEEKGQLMDAAKRPQGRQPFQ